MWKHYLIGIVISVFAVWLFLRAVSLEEMGRALAQMNPIYLLPCLLIYLLSFVVRAWRWHFLMRPVARIGLRPLFAALMVGFLGNNLLPAHLGEVVRAYVVGHSQGVSKSAVFATVVLERVYDGLTVLLLLVFVLVFMDLPQGEVQGSMITVANLRTAGWLGFSFFAGTLLILQGFRWKKERTLALLAFCLKPVPTGLRDKMLEMAAAFAQGLNLTKASDLFFIALTSLLTWILLGAWAWSLFPAFGVKLGLMSGILMEVVVALALLIPAAPAFVGTFHLAATATLAFMGASSAVAGSYALMLWLVHFVVTSLVGLYCLWQQGLGWAAFKTGGRTGGE